MTDKGKELTETQALEKAVDTFSAAMKARLLSKEKQGWTGWDGMGRSALGERLLLNAAQGVTKKAAFRSLIDTANLAMMIYLDEKRRKL